MLPGQKWPCSARRRPARPLSRSSRILLNHQTSVPRRWCASPRGLPPNEDGRSLSHPAECVNLRRLALAHAPASTLVCCAVGRGRVDKDRDQDKRHQISPSAGGFDGPEGRPVQGAVGPIVDSLKQRRGQDPAPDSLAKGLGQRLELSEAADDDLGEGDSQKPEQPSTHDVTCSPAAILARILLQAGSDDCMTAKLLAGRGTRMRADHVLQMAGAGQTRLTGALFLRDPSTPEMSDA